MEKREKEMKERKKKLVHALRGLAQILVKDCREPCNCRRNKNYEVSGTVSK